MRATLEVVPHPVGRDELAPAIEEACRRIAPAWPLDRLIAVNPYWGFVGLPIEEAAAELTALTGTRLLMPHEWYRAQWEAGRFTERQLREALLLAGSHQRASDMLDTLAAAPITPRVRLLLTDLADEGRDLTHQMSWGEFVIRHVSQASAACFDEGQARWMPDRSSGLYTLWRSLAERDRSPRLLMGFRGFGAAIRLLPAEPRALIAAAVEALAVPPEARAGYFTALLMTLPGWAASCAHRRWEARLRGGDDDQLVNLLAVRLAWELLLYRRHEPDGLAHRWVEARRQWVEAAPAARAEQRDEWALQRALELAFQERLIGSLGRPSEVTAAAPTVQAVFCIDVRSEVYRRALEATDTTIHTLGFAGFFGLPIAYAPPVGPARAQLPGLLAPGLMVRDRGEASGTVADDLRRTLERKSALKDLSGTAASAFSFVEIAGFAYAAALLSDGLSLGGPAADPLRSGLRGPRADSLRPELAGHADGGNPLTPEARADLAASVLRGMSLTGGFARLVAVIGHGAGTTNNPQAAGLHCGACGGQTGEVNARALAALLNDPDVRRGLAERGIVLPETTWVVAGLHNTTTDDVRLFDLGRIPDGHREDIAALQRRLAEAGQKARAERAGSLGIGNGNSPGLDAAVRRRAADWSELRPEWGLAKNAAFVVAPRARTRGVDLGGRVFLQEYRWQEDDGHRVLEQIMTAPMVVTHWINMQYYASTVDNRRYGSGNKVLHNVVGGRLGVFEGAGGDLRIGLAMQSVHDGRDWVHEPLRLSVFIEAPAEAIDGIIARHQLVHDLIANEWLFLFRIDPGSGAIQQRRGGGWHTAPSADRRGETVALPLPTRQ